MKIAILLALAFMPLNAMAQDVVTQDTPEKFLDIQEVTSDAGLSAWLVEDNSIPIIALRFAFKGTGAKTDPADRQGLASMASNTMDEGAGDLDSEAFQKSLSDLSISLRFIASRDNFGGSLKTLSRNKAKAFELLKLALNEPRFDKEPVDRMRKSNQSRIKSSLSNPKWMAARIQNDRIFEGHPYSKNSGGMLSSLESITSDDLRAFHKSLGKNQLVIGASGDITAEELKTLLDDIFGDLPVREIKETQKHPLKNIGATYLYEQDIPQTIIRISQAGISRKDEDYYNAKIMNFILGESGFGSRLMEEAREKRGLTYGIYSYFQEFDESEILKISTSTANENTANILDIITSEWDKIKTVPVSEDELANAKSYLIGSLPLSLTSTASIASTLLSMQMDELPIDYLDLRSDLLEKVTIEDVQGVAQRILNEDDFTTILVGNPQGFDDANIITKLPNVE